MPRRWTEEGGATGAGSKAASELRFHGLWRVQIQSETGCS